MNTAVRSTAKFVMLRVVLGPFAYWRRSKAATVLLVAAVVVLTAASQVGGMLLWLMLPLLGRVHRALRPRGRWVAGLAAAMLYIGCHVLVSLALVPLASRWADRRPLQCFATAEVPYQASSWLYCLLNRHNGRPEVHDLLAGLAAHLAARFPGAVLVYLDAGFPFIDGFPLPPHLSHGDGRKVDLAFFYRDSASGSPIATGGAWPLGYWAYAGPETGESAPCRGRTPALSLRWDFDWLQPLFQDRQLDPARTGEMIAWLVANAERGAVGKILLEPHLKDRLGLTSDLIRFQGCRAARHDDHLHVELR